MAISRAGFLKNRLLWFVLDQVTKTVHDGYMPSFTLRLPDELYKVLKAHAERKQRSLNAQVVYILLEYFGLLKKQDKRQA